MAVEADRYRVVVVGGATVCLRDDMSRFDSSPALLKAEAIFWQNAQRFGLSSSVKTAWREVYSVPHLRLL
jgi:hypothetical protein